MSARLPSLNMISVDQSAFSFTFLKRDWSGARANESTPRLICSNLNSDQNVSGLRLEQNVLFDPWVWHMQC